MTLSILWIEDGNLRPKGRQADLFPRLCCAEVARRKGWSWGRAARAMRRLLDQAPGSSMRGISIEGAVLDRV